MLRPCNVGRIAWTPTANHRLPNLRPGDALRVLPGVVDLGARPRGASLLRAGRPITSGHAMTTDALLVTWMRAERLLELLPDGDPDRMAVRRTADALDAAYHELSTGYPVGDWAGLSSDTVARAQTLIARVLERYAMTLEGESVGMLDHIARYLGATVQAAVADHGQETLA